MLPFPAHSVLVWQESDLRTILVECVAPPTTMNKGDIANVRIRYSSPFRLVNYRAHIVCSGALSIVGTGEILLSEPVAPYSEFVFNINAVASGSGSCRVIVYADGTVPGSPSTCTGVASFNVSVQ